MIYQVTAIYEGDEVGYGEGESYEYAASECADSVPSIYPPEDVEMVSSQGILTVSMSLALYREFASSPTIHSCAAFAATPNPRRRGDR